MIDDPRECDNGSPTHAPERPKKKYKSRDELPSTNCIVAVRLAFPDISINAIAKILGVSVGTVHSRMSSVSYSQALSRAMASDTYNTLRIEARENISPALKALRDIIDSDTSRDVDRVAAVRASIYALERLDHLTHLETDRLAVRAEVEALRESRGAEHPEDIAAREVEELEAGDDTDDGDTPPDAPTPAPEVPASPPPPVVSPLPEAPPPVELIPQSVNDRFAEILAKHKAKG